MSEKSAREFLIRNQAGYQPHSGVKKDLRTNNPRLRTISGPFDVERSSLIKTVVQMDPMFSRARSLTTRLPRNGEDSDQYDFRSGKDKYKRLQRLVQSRNLVQYVMAPFNDELYGTLGRHYRSDSGRVLLIDVMPVSLDNFEDLPIADFGRIGVTATIEDWKKMSAGRYSQNSPAEMKSREMEGVSGLEILLEYGDEVDWVQTHYEKPQIGARELIGIVRGVTEPDPDNRRVAEAQRKYMRGLI